MLPGALLYFGSGYTKGFLVKSAIRKREDNRRIAESLGFAPDPPLDDEAEAATLEVEGYILLAKIFGFVVFNLGVLTIFL